MVNPFNMYTPFLYLILGVKLQATPSLVSSESHLSSSEESQREESFEYKRLYKSIYIMIIPIISNKRITL